MGGGPTKGAAELTGGALNYTFIVLNLILSWLGWLLVLASLAALQNQINKHQDVQTPTNNFYRYHGVVANGVFTNKDQVEPLDVDTFHSYAVNAGYPALPPGRLLRFEW